MITAGPTPPVTPPVTPPAPAATGADESAASSRWPWPVQVLVSVVALVIALVGGALLASALTAALGVDSEATEVPAGLLTLLTLVPCLTVMVVAIVLTSVAARFDGRRRLADLVGRVGPRRHLVALLVGLAISVVVVWGVGAALTATGLTRPGDDVTPGLPLAAAVIIGLAQAFALQGIPEELLFRGYLLGSLRLRPVATVTVAALAFGVIHLASNGGQTGWGERLLYLVLPTGFALTAGALTLATGSVAAAIGIHAGLHLANLVAGLVAATVPGLGWGDGPIVWVVSGVVYAAVAAVIMRRRRRTA